MLVQSDFLSRLYAEFHNAEMPGTYIVIAAIVMVYAASGLPYEEVKSNWIKNYVTLSEAGLKADIGLLYRAFSDHGAICPENYAVLMRELEGVARYGQITFQVSDLMWATYRCVTEE